MNQRQVMWVL